MQYITRAACRPGVSVVMYKRNLVLQAHGVSNQHSTGRFKAVVSRVDNMSMTSDIFQALLVLI